MPQKVDKNTKIDYWTRRLDHSLNNVRDASKLIYIVDGAVLAFVYFLIDKTGSSRPAILGFSFIFLLLFVINYLHAELIRHLNHAYLSINIKLLLLVGEESEHSWPGGNFVIKRDLYRLIHLVISFSLLIIFFMMLFYGIGCFPEVKTNVDNSILSQLDATSPNRTDIESQEEDPTHARKRVMCLPSSQHAKQEG